LLQSFSFVLFIFTALLLCFVFKTKVQHISFSNVFFLTFCLFYHKFVFKKKFSLQFFKLFESVYYIFVTLVLFYFLFCFKISVFCFVCFKKTNTPVFTCCFATFANFATITF